MCLKKEQHSIDRCRCSATESNSMPMLKLRSRQLSDVRTGLFSFLSLLGQIATSPISNTSTCLGGTCSCNGLLPAQLCLSLTLDVVSSCDALRSLSDIPGSPETNHHFNFSLHTLLRHPISLNREEAISLLCPLITLSYSPPQEATSYPSYPTSIVSIHKTVAQPYVLHRGC